MLDILTDLFKNAVNTTLSDEGFSLSCEGYSPDEPQNNEKTTLGIYASELNLAIPKNADDLDSSRGSAFEEKTQTLDCTAAGKAFALSLDPGYVIASVVRNNKILKPGQDYTADTNNIHFSFEPLSNVELLLRKDSVSGFTESRLCDAKIVYEIKTEVGESYQNLHSVIFHQILKTGATIDVVLHGYDDDLKTSTIFENIKVRFQKQSSVREDASNLIYKHITTEFIFSAKMSMTVAAGETTEVQQIEEIHLKSGIGDAANPESISYKNYTIETEP